MIASDYQGKIGLPLHNVGNDGASDVQGIRYLLQSLCFVTKIHGNIQQSNPVPAENGSDSSWVNVCIMIVDKKELSAKLLVTENIECALK